MTDKIKQEFEDWIAEVLIELLDSVTLARDQRKASDCDCKRKYYDGVIYGHDNCIATMKVNLNNLRREQLK